MALPPSSLASAFTLTQHPSRDASAAAEIPPSPYDRLTSLAQRLLNVPIAVVAFTERDRLVYQSCVGLPGDGIRRSGALCDLPLREGDLIVIEDTRADARTATHPHVTGGPRIRFYAGAPLRTPDGYAIGTFCVASDAPRVLTTDALHTFRDLVAMATSEVQLQYEVRQHGQTMTLLRTALEDASHQLEHIAEAFVSLDPDWRVVYANPQALKATGLAWHEIVGQNVWERFPGASETKFYGELHRAMEEQKPVVVEDRYGAAQRYYRMKAVPHRKGLSLLMSDVTERRQAEQALRNSEARFRLLIEHLSDILCVLDAHGRVLSVSPSCTGVLGRTPEEFVGTDAFAYLHPDDRETARKAVAQILEHPGVTAPIDVRWARPDGTFVPLELVANNLLDEPAIHGLVITARDATERRRAMEALRRSLEKEREVNDLRSNFVAMVSHEFRTPLATILSSSQLAERLLTVHTEKAQKHLNRIHGTVHDMIALLDDVLALERTSLKETDVVQAIELPHLLAELFDELQVGMGARHELRLTGTVPPVMHADRTTLRLILMNLLTNAVKYSDTGTEVVLDVSCPEPGAPVVVFCVTDHGIGIPEHEQHLLFEPFHRAGNVGKIQGTGLGLSMVKQAVDRWGGSISVRSTVGRGTTVRVLLPLTVRPTQLPVS